MDYLFEPGKRLGDRYKVKRPLGIGGLSEVYVVDAEDGFQHVLKVALPAKYVRADDRGSLAERNAQLMSPLERTMRETKMLQQLSNEHVIKPWAVLKDLTPDGACGLLMEHVQDAHTLDEIMRDLPLKQVSDTRALMQLVKDPHLCTPQHPVWRFVEKYGSLEKTRHHLSCAEREKPQSEQALENEMFAASTLMQGYKEIMQRYASFLPQLERGVEHLIQRSVIHKDLHPKNVIVAGMHTVKIIDFGLASAPAERDTPWAARTVRPPESYWRVLDPTADLWSLGVLVHQAVRGYHPLSRSGDRQVIEERCKALFAITSGSQHTLFHPLPKEEMEEFVTDVELLLSGFPYTAAAVHAFADGLHRWNDAKEGKFTPATGRLSEHDEREATKWRHSRYRNAIGETLQPKPKDAELDRTALRLATYLNIDPASRQELRRQEEYNPKRKPFVAGTDSGITYSIYEVDNGTSSTTTKPAQKIPTAATPSPIVPTSNPQGSAPGQGMAIDAGAIKRLEEYRRRYQLPHASSPSSTDKSPVVSTANPLGGPQNTVKPMTVTPGSAVGGPSQAPETVQYPWSNMPRVQGLKSSPDLAPPSHKRPTSYATASYSLQNALRGGRIPVSADSEPTTVYASLDEAIDPKTHDQQPLQMPSSVMKLELVDGKYKRVDGEAQKPNDDPPIKTITYDLFSKLGQNAEAPQLTTDDPPIRSVSYDFPGEFAVPLTPDPDGKLRSYTRFGQKPDPLAFLRRKKKDK